MKMESLLESDFILTNGFQIVLRKASFKEDSYFHLQHNSKTLIYSQYNLYQFLETLNIKDGTNLINCYRNISIFYVKVYYIYSSFRDVHCFKFAHIYILIDILNVIVQHEQCWTMFYVWRKLRARLNSEYQSCYTEYLLCLLISLWTDPFGMRRIMMR